MGNTKRMILVCEDKAHEVFMTQCLKCFVGLKSKITRDLWSWVASEEKAGGNVDDVIVHVNDGEYGSWLSRCKGNHKVLLIVVVDDDLEPSDKRRGAFPVCQEQAFRDLFVVVVPKRNVESWVNLGMKIEDPAGTNDRDDYGDKWKSKYDQGYKCVRNAAADLCGRLDSCADPLASNAVWKQFSEAMSAVRNGVSALYDHN